VDKRRYGSQDDITVVCDGWGILYTRALWRRSCGRRLWECIW